MVNTVPLETVLNITDVKERTSQLKRGFAPHSSMLFDVSGLEQIALVILINLTWSAKDKPDDLLDKLIAKKQLANSNFLSCCVDEVAWFHTHNLKYPDIRVSMQRILSLPPNQQAKVLSSADVPMFVDWAHDAKKVNYTKLFAAEFIWHGQKCSLAKVFKEIEPEWKAAFQSMGGKVQDLKIVSDSLNRLLPPVELPETVDYNSPQIRMPYRDDYIAVTPVVSSAMLLAIQQSYARTTELRFTRPASVGGLVSSLGGRVKVLHYPPNLARQEQSFSQNQLGRLNEIGSILNSKVLRRKDFIASLERLSRLGYIATNRQQRIQLHAQQKLLRTIVLQWLAPLFELREAIVNEPQIIEKLSSISDSTEYEFLLAPVSSLKQFVNPFFACLNNQLSNYHETQHFAFEFRLMPVFRKQIRWALSQIESASHLGDDDDMNVGYLHIKALRLFDGSALSNMYCSGIPSLTAIWGMLHHYQRELNTSLGINIRCAAFSWFIRNYSSSTETKLPEFDVTGTKQREFKRRGLIEGRYCDMTFDLVVRIEGEANELTQLANAEDALKAHLPARLAGGTLLPPPVSSSTVSWCQLHQNSATFFKDVGQLPYSGRWVLPTRKTISSVNEIADINKINRAFVPTHLGYLFLEVPKHRTGAHASQHCYAESAIGLVEFTRQIEIRMQGARNFYQRAFWQLDVEEDSMLMGRA
jgi:CRISPR-associated protein Csy2